MKKKWTILATLGTLTPLAATMPMLVTSCMTHVRNVIVGMGAFDNKKIVVSDGNFEQWINNLNSVKIKDKLSKLEIKDDFFDKEADEAIKSISVIKKNGDGSSQKIEVTIELKGNYHFYKSNSDGSKSKSSDNYPTKWTLTITLAKQ